MKIPFFLWLLLMPIGSLFLSFGIFVASDDQCLGDQQSLLLQLKNSLLFDNDLSTKLVHWNQSADCCLWEGVMCSEGRVIGLDLSGEYILGGLDNSSSLFDLQYLQHLNLAGNNFDCEIPSKFDRLTNLSYLDLSDAGFQGQIPIAISRLTRLVTLCLSDFEPESTSLQLENPNLNMLIHNLSELKELYLQGVNISMQGYEWCRALSSSLPNLRVLSMSGCYLSGPLDSSLLKLQSLSIVDLSYNYFSSPVPEFFADFKNLTSLYFSSSGLNGKFPKKIFQIPTLQMIDLSHNELLQGSLPEFPLNGFLQTLVLSHTNFAGTVPYSIGNLKMLSEVDISSCNFRGEIPKSMANLTQLLYLDMSFNSFNGSIPPFSMSKNLTNIILSNNDLTGQIASTQWEELLNLKVLELSYNSLEGSIPVSLFSLPLLRELELHNNRFSGGLDEFPNSSYQLEYLDLSHNNLEGSIPVSLFSLPLLRELKLHNNRFSGRLNEFPNSSYQLEYLDLSHNNLEGPIPMSVFELQSLNSLSLSFNNFSDSLQLNVIQRMRNLSDLDLSYNKLLIEFDGTNSSLSSFPQITTLKLASSKLKTFPHFLRNQSQLDHLDLSDNKIHGEIPNWILKRQRLTTLNLSYNYLTSLDFSLLNYSFMSVLDLCSNQLQGQLPLSSYARFLDFSRNNFHSIIPTSIGNSLTEAYFLSVSSNKLYGSIPISICNFTLLQVLDLSDNSLNGMIPQCLIEMSEKQWESNLTLGVLDLRRNNLTGAISDTFPSNCGFQTLDLNGNQLEGKLPKSLAKCTKLKVLDVGNNRIEDAFPCYLKNISMLGVLILRSNKFYGSICCQGLNATWPMLQIVDLASNNFIGKLPIKYFSNWKAMMDYENESQSQLNHLQYEDVVMGVYYQDAVTVTLKGQSMELVKILTIFTSLDFSCNNFDGFIPEEIGELKLLFVLNLSHNAFTGQIPLSLGKLSSLESLDLSRNKLTGEIPIQLADGLIFLAVLNLSFNQLVGQIPQTKQFATFSETSYEGNTKLCGFPLKEKCIHEKSGSSSPALEELHSNSGIAIDWNYLSVELGFIFGFGIVIGPLMFWKKWRIWYYKHADGLLHRICPKLYPGKEYHQRQRHRNHGLRH